MRILITDCDHGFFDPEHRAAREAGAELAIAQCESPADVIDAARGYDGIVCQAAPITRAVLEALPDCRVVGRYGTGLDSVDLDAARELGKTVVHTPGFCTAEVADHALACLLALARRLPSTRIGPDSAAILADYPSRTKLAAGVMPMSAATVGIVGLGRIGREMAGRLAALGSTVLGHDPYIDADSIDHREIRIATFDELLAESDFVTLHVPLTERSRNMIGAAEMARMKPGAALVNVSRGGLVDEGALASAVRSGQLSGAALDVTVEEPIPLDHPLVGIPQILLTPHLAFYSDSALEDVKERTVRYVANALHGEGEFVAAA